nr:hypothetical protein [uncultured Oscillibacter sp.]
MASKFELFNKELTIDDACFRFVIEFFRGDEIRGIFFGLSTSQWISFMIVLYYTKKHFSKESALTDN